MKQTPQDIRKRILKVLARLDGPAGASRIAELLRGWGVDLSERSIRLHLAQLDREGLTELQSRRAGRKLTARGHREVDRGDVVERLGFISGQIDELTYKMGFRLRTSSGTLVVNTTLVPAENEAAAVEVVRPVFAARLGMGSRLLIRRAGELYDVARAAKVPPGKIALVTVCSVTLNGILLKEGIPVTSRYGGLLEFRNHLPVRFVELLEYGGTTQDPLELFIRARMTRVRQCVQSGEGVVGASFREFPSSALPDVLKIRDQLRLIGLDGIRAVGMPNQPLYGIPVGEGRTGLIVLGGLNPAAALTEAGLVSENRSLAGLLDYREFPEFRHLNMWTQRGE
ncbi:MAG: NrpR regulatory domain-containing protein [Kiritimatiellae bacterium]|nr:NrpR regulatory domain-containing protein [Kiritimatiellia bacterium]MDY0150041.1 NrpR regulatory domain-containing protein [Kiritimatiellia bacterium]